MRTMMLDETDVSIHAPAGGATLRAAGQRGEAMFQFTLPRGERRGGLGGGIRLVSGFNSRSRGGSDQGGREWPASRACFNSRSRGGSDGPDAEAIRAKAQFQFTLPRGERPIASTALIAGFAFQFTLPRGERHKLMGVR